MSPNRSADRRSKVTSPDLVKSGDAHGNGGDPKSADPHADFAPLPEGRERAHAAHAEVAADQQSSLQAEAAFEQAVAAAETDEEQGVQEYLKAAAVAEASREWYLAAVACERVGDFLLNPKPPVDLQRALRMYRRSAAAYENCGLYDEARNVSYREMRLRLSRAAELRLSIVQRVELGAYWLTAGFGLRPLRVVGTALIVILLYALLYWSIGGVMQVGQERPANLVEAIYFSGITFSTVGYGDFLPAPHARLVALSEGFLGAFLMGLFVVVLAQRLARA